MMPTKLHCYNSTSSSSNVFVCYAHKGTNHYQSNMWWAVRTYICHS